MPPPRLLSRWPNCWVWVRTSPPDRSMLFPWLGIDIATGGSRALLVNSAGHVIAAHTVAHEDMLMLHPLWAEQRPANWWDAAVGAIQGVLAQANVTGSDIKGIGLSGQMHGLV